MDRYDVAALGRVALPGQPIQEVVAFKRTRLGLLTQQKGSPDLFAQMVARMQLLALSEETDQAKTELRGALDLPWWGMRIVAIKAFYCLGGVENTAWLEHHLFRSRVFEEYSKEYFWTSDAGSAISLAKWFCQNVQGHFGRWTIIFGCKLHPATFAALSEEAAQHLLERMLRESQGLARNRLALTLVDRRNLPSRTELLNILANGDDQAAMTARSALENDSAAKPSTMSATEFRLLLTSIPFKGHLLSTHDVTHRTLHLWSSGQLPVPDGIASWLRLQAKIDVAKCTPVQDYPYCGWGLWKHRVSVVTPRSDL